MTILGSILNTFSPEQTARDYVEVDLNGGSDQPVTTKQHIQFAELSGQKSAIEIKDAVYEGDIVVADIARFKDDKPLNHIIEDIERVVHEVGGDMVQKGDHQLIITPRDTGIARHKLTD